VLKQKMRVPDEPIDEFDALLRAESVVVPKAKVFSIEIRDKSDMPVLAEVISGKVEVLVTGDKDFHEIAEVLRLAVLTPRGLWERLRVPSREQ
jgi:predicted nucleic acid-binding protein